MSERLISEFPDCALQIVAEGLDEEETPLVITARCTRCQAVLSTRSLSVMPKLIMIERMAESDVRQALTHRCEGRPR